MLAAAPLAGSKSLEAQKELRNWGTWFWRTERSWHRFELKYVSLDEIHDEVGTLAQADGRTRYNKIQQLAAIRSSFFFVFF